MKGLTKIASADFSHLFYFTLEFMCAFITNSYLFFSCGPLLPPHLHHPLHPSLLIRCNQSQRSLHLESHKTFGKDTFSIQTIIQTP